MLTKKSKGLCAIGMAAVSCAYHLPKSIVQSRSLRARQMVKGEFFFWLLFCLILSPQIPSISGCITWRGHACAMAMSAAFGLRLASLLSALAPSVLPVRNRPFAAITIYFTPSPTSCHRSPFSRNILNCMVTCATSIPSTIVSSTLLCSKTLVPYCWLCKDPCWDGKDNAWVS